MQSRRSPRPAGALLALAALSASPAPLRAQVDVDLPGRTVRTGVGPWSLGASIGAHGIDLRVGTRTGPERRAPPSPRPTGRGPSTGRSPAGSSPTGPSAGGAGRRRTSAAGSAATATSVLATARRYLGTRYVWGGTTPRGFDCSGFVQYVFRRHGVTLPRTSRQQARAGTRVGLRASALKPGDLLLFASKGSRIDHIAIYAGRNRIIHSSSSGGGVRYDDLSTRRGRWFRSKHVATRRVIGSGGALARELERALAADLAGPLDPPDPGPPR